MASCLGTSYNVSWRADGPATTRPPGGHMTKRTIAIARLTGLAAWIAGSAAAMPQMGQVSIAPGIGAALVSNQDIKDFYGPGLTANSSPVAASIGAGIDYNV